MDAVLDTLLKGFAGEAEGYVKSLRKAVTPGAKTPAAMLEIYNLFQILASSATALKIQQIAEPAGSACALLEPLTETGGELAAGQISQLAGWLDAIQDFATSVRENSGPNGGSAQPPAAKSSLSLSDDLLSIFATEAQEHGETIQAGLAQLQANPGDQEAMREVRRATHTLKGAAASVGIEPVAQLAHVMEDLLELYIEVETSLPPESVALLVESADVLDGLSAADPQGKTFDLLESLLQRYEQIARPEPAAIKPDTQDLYPELAVQDDKLAASQREIEGTLRVPMKQVDLLINQVGEVAIGHSAIEGYLKGFKNLLVELDYSSRRLQRLTRDIEAQIEVAAHEQIVSHDVADSHFDPLELDRYTTLYQLTRGLEEVASDTTNVNRELQDLTQTFDASLIREHRLTTEIQNHLMTTRMVPFQTIETRLRRTVRQTARDLGKSVDFILSGQDVLLDKTVLDSLTEALMHLIRNGIDHGLESSEKRLAAGKPATGTLSLAVKRDRGRTILRLSDDGAGIDIEKVRQRGIALGLITEDQNVSQERLIDLLFEEDFSLAEKVTHTSGRGIGLNIVRRAIKMLQGTIRVESMLGQGTTFILSTPVTLAIARTLTIRSCGSQYAVPLEQITSVLRLSPEMMQEIALQGIVRHEGRAYSVFDLTTFVNPNAEAQPGQRYGLVLDHGDGATMILVDSVMGIQETVIKSLGSHLKRVRGLSGATITGHGEVVLILDLMEVVAADNVSVGQHNPLAAPARTVDASNLHVLVVDDSLSVRRAVCLTLEQAGWQTTTAKDGIEALEKLLDVRPDVALLDIEMPRMNGFELLARIRSEADLRSLPVIFLTSRASAKHRERAQELGCDGYIVKPYRNEELIDEVRRVASVRQI